MVSALSVDVDTANVTTNGLLSTTTLNATRTPSVSVPENGTGADFDAIFEYPPYLKVTSITLCVLILVFGVVGNIMVPVVIIRTKDMRNSTNIFLMNLSLADLLVLIICTPTVLVELNSRPETWVLGEHLCKIIPFVELTVAHASVLTILAITFERYYAICEPLRAGYVCTKARAIVICIITWLVAAFCTSPMLMLMKFEYELYADGTTQVPVCWTISDIFWTRTFFLCTITVFFFLPLITLAALYITIAKHLMANPGIAAPNSNTSALRYRRQVVMMLGTVVFTFFVCLLPYRALTLWLMFVPYEWNIMSLYGYEAHYQVLSFCRFMLYLNSAINPILYNLMSSKFRDGFRKLCGFKNGGCGVHLGRRGTITTTSANTTGLTFSSQRNATGTSISTGGGAGAGGGGSFSTPTPNACLSSTPKKKSFVNLISIEDYEKPDGIFKKLSITTNIIKLQESYV